MDLRGATQTTASKVKGKDDEQAQDEHNNQSVFESWTTEEKKGQKYRVCAEAKSWKVGSPAFAGGGPCSVTFTLSTRSRLENKSPSPIC